MIEKVGLDLILEPDFCKMPKQLKQIADFIKKHEDHAYSISLLEITRNSTITGIADQPASYNFKVVMSRGSK